MARLGDILVEQGALSREHLEHSAQTARGRLGDYLRSHGLIKSRDLAQALAHQWGLPYREDAADRTLFRTADVPHYLAHHYIPFGREGEKLLLATPQPDMGKITALQERYGCPVRLVVISHRDFSRLLLDYGARAVTREAKLRLKQTYPSLGAHRTLLKHQARGLLILVAALAIWLAIAPKTSWGLLLVACNLFYLVTLAFKLQLYLQGRAAWRTERRSRRKLLEEVAALNDADLPVYTLLVPVYRESPEVIQRLIGKLESLDYPKEKLDIKIICEADDQDTIHGLMTLRPPETMEIIRVPPSSPRTKPKACNVALQQIRGELLVIYDAEDAPEPDQLKRAVVTFRHASARTACLQAPLNYYNRKENMLTRLFAIEYSMLFRILLPALERMELPIPLGGTSNHLRVSALQEAGGWDAFNVTEDADLGIRLAWLGYRTQMLHSLTMEEAPVSLKAWMKQRTRWIKGYIQTWLVYMRDPIDLKKRLGRQSYYGFQFFVGAPALTFLFAPIFWAIFLFSLLGFFPAHLSPFLLALCLITFVGGMASHWLFARAVVQQERWEGMEKAGIVFPFYWLLHSVACARALWQLATAPHYWEKTTHGVSTLFKR